MNSFADKNISCLLKAAKVVFNFIITDSFRGFAYLSLKTETSFKDDESVNEMMNKFNDEYLEKGWGLLLTCIRCWNLIFITLSTIFKNSSDYSKIMLYQWPIFFVIVAILDKLFQNFKKCRGLILSILIYFIGAIIIYRSVWKTTYALYENWMIFISIILIGSSTKNI